MIVLYGDELFILLGILQLLKSVLLFTLGQSSKISRTGQTKVLFTFGFPLGFSTSGAVFAVDNSQPRYTCGRKR